MPPLEPGELYRIPSRAEGYYVGRFTGIERGRYRFDVDQYGIYAVLTESDFTQVVKYQQFMCISEKS